LQACEHTVAPRTQVPAKDCEFDSNLKDADFSKKIDIAVALSSIDVAAAFEINSEA